MSTLTILACLASVLALANSVCTNVDLIGYDRSCGGCPGKLLTLDLTSNLFDCAEQCNDRTKCKGFLLHDERMCFLFTNLKCGSSPPKFDPKNVFYSKHFHTDLYVLDCVRVKLDGYDSKCGNCPDSYGEYIKYIKYSNPRDCAERCNDRRTCKAFMLRDGRNCFLRTVSSCTAMSTRNRGEVFYTNTQRTAKCAKTDVSGYSSRCGNCPRNGIIRYDHSNLNDCAKRCNRRSNCAAFLLYDGRLCILKTASCRTTTIDPKDPKSVFYTKRMRTACVKTDVSGFNSRCGDCPGNDITRYSHTNLNDCAKQCNLRSNCAAFMLRDGRTCFLKTASCTTPSTADPKSVFYTKRTGNCGKTDVSGYNSRCGDCPRVGIIHSSQTNLNDCAERCNRQSDCAAFMLYDGRLCQLKIASCRTTTTDPKDPKYVFYTKRMRTACVKTDVSGYSSRCGDCPGNDITRYSHTNLNDCAKQCNRRSNCAAFMLRDGRTCFLKTASCTTPSTADQKSVFYTKHIRTGLTSTVCERKTMELSCANQNEVLQIDSAIYGRTDSTTCGGKGVTNCVAPSSLPILRSKCNGKRYCSVVVSNGVFGDPCRGTEKYLSVRYQCVTAKPELKYSSTVTSNGKYYVAVTSTGSWSAQLAACRAEAGFDLAAIPDKDTWNDVKKNVVSQVGLHWHRFWIGGTDTAEEGKWRWSYNDALIDLVKIKPVLRDRDGLGNKANEDGGAENCMEAHDVWGGINDRPCSKSYRALCQKFF